jgi:hypothetical protein
MPIELWVLLGGVALWLYIWVNCAIAERASGAHGRVSPFWGLLGPVGWLIAALRGVQERLP